MNLKRRFSKVFQRFEESFRKEILPALRKAEPNVMDLSITDVRNGSVVVDFLILCSTNNVTEKTVLDAIQQGSTDGTISGVISLPTVEGI